MISELNEMLLALNFVACLLALIWARGVYTLALSLLLLLQAVELLALFLYQNSGVKPPTALVQVVPLVTLVFVIMVASYLKSRASLAGKGGTE